ncbi:recombination mediator RecR [Desulfomonile tiedjei]|uniref:Recombination protein RecR n=1 Tax=Desulfomonile tiedjei (strain ATCC 49306 / DSM 6799 / DCB-1) TaxID=706587 RepID=I4CDK3_DESTA|nr:recombination mediator RecR [Desulfomonile tiedjei]AFM27644.1 DNA replication and repair protein RecR [Desulfomonile tiedjei DSM 6799]
MRPLEDLIEVLKRFPGVGEKTATRYAFYVMHAGDADIQQLIRAIKSVKEKLRLCSRCFHLTDVDPCQICTDKRRDPTRLCVVETPMDLLAIEKAGQFRGLYHVLHGVLSPLDGIGPGDIRFSELLDRVRDEGVREVILAFNPTVEGESTSSFIAERIKSMDVSVSRIAYGIPVGGSLEYSDPLTLSRALDNRKPM